MLKSRRTFIATAESIARQYPVEKIVPSLETIAFQRNDFFGPAMEEICSRFKELVDQKLAPKVIAKNTALIQEFEELVFDRFGLKVRLDVSSDSVASVIPETVIANNPLLSRWAREFLSIIDSKDIDEVWTPPEVKDMGTISTEKAKVTGWFSTIDIPIFINFNILMGYYNCSPAEVTAVILHEIGHAFNALLFTSRINTTNQVIADIAKHIKKNNKRPDVEYIFKEIKKIDPDSNKDIAEGLASGNAVVMGTATYRLIVGTCKTLMNDINYDETAFESISDVFAARFGYAECLLSSLEKMRKDFDEVQNYRDSNSRTLFTVVYLLLIAVAAIGAAISAPAMIIAGIITTVISFIFAAFIVRAKGDDMEDKTYDTLKMRYMRIRLQLVEAIKNPALTTTEKKNLLEQLLTMDQIIKSIKSHEGVVMKIANTIFSGARNSKQSMDEQHRWEQMISNDLFVKSAQLEVSQK